MRILRWAADKTTATKDRERLVALSVLEALDDSEMLQAEDQGILNAVLKAATADAEMAVEQYPDESGGYEVEVASDNE